MSAFVFGIGMVVFVCASSRVWKGKMNYIISKIYPGFGHSKLQVFFVRCFTCLAYIPGHPQI